MSPLTSGVAVGVFGVLLIGTVGASASRALGFAYARLVPLQFVVWASAGVVAAFAAESFGVAAARAATAGLLVGAVDSTVGWWLSRRIGPGMPAGYTEDMLSSELLIAAAIRVSFRAGTLAGIAGAFSRVLAATS